MLRAAAALGLKPEEFWRLSLKEWRMLAPRPAETSVMARVELERLREVWPDE